MRRCAKSRALAVQARTLELYRQLDLTDQVLREGYRVPALTCGPKATARFTLPFAQFNSSLSPYGPLTLPQDQHERLLAARLQGARREHRAVSRADRLR